MLQILFAGLAGILTITAPCILLPLPILLGGSVGQQSRTRPLFITLGFIVTFASLALAINEIVQRLGLNPNTLRTIAVLVLAIFSLFMIWPAQFDRLMTHLSGLVNKAGQTSGHVSQGNFGGFILGAVIGVVWAPCAGPILGTILTLVALQRNMLLAGTLLIAYAIGAGIPMLAVAYGGQALTARVRSIAKYSYRIQQVFGVILLLLATAIYFQYDTAIEARLAAVFPSFGNNLEQALVQQSNLKRQLTNSNQSADKKNMEKIEFYNYGPAPEFAGISHWLNSEPLTIAGLKDKVVLIDFWTYSCINCIRTLPYVTKWYDTYKDNGLVVVGVHTPEFAFEKETANVQDAIARFGINYPVAQDNDYGTWNNYNNQYWPAEYLIDKKGNIVYVHFGEGNNDHTENAIRTLLGLNEEQTQAFTSDDLNSVQSLEMYFGTARLQNLTTEQTAVTSVNSYSLPKTLRLNTFALDGEWHFTTENLILAGDKGKIKLKFHAGKVHIVADSPTMPAELTVVVDGKTQPTVTVNGPELYTLFSSNDYTDHDLEIEVRGKGFEAFTFTFG